MIRYNLLMGFRWLRLTDRLRGLNMSYGGTYFYDYWEGSLPPGIDFGEARWEWKACCLANATRVSALTVE